MKYSLEDIEHLLVKSKYHKSTDEWFFPSDLMPFSSALKYSCKKLHEQGKLERSEANGRWGYSYRIKQEAK